MSSNDQNQNQSYSYSSSQSYASFSSNINGEQRSYSQSTHTDPTGTRVHRMTQEPGHLPREEHFQYDKDGRRLEQGTEGRGRIEDVTDKEQAERDRAYEERIEDEYAKREGGA